MWENHAVQRTAECARAKPLDPPIFRALRSVEVPLRALMTRWMLSAAEFVCSLLLRGANYNGHPWLFVEVLIYRHLS